MGMSYILLLTAFYVYNGKSLPLWKELPPFAYWILPGAIGVPSSVARCCVLVRSDDRLKGCGANVGNEGDDHWIPPRYVPHNHHLLLVMGPVAIIAASALAGAASSRGSKWWLLALIGPLSCAVLLITAGA
jgi:hypothetical protein